MHKGPTMEEAIPLNPSSVYTAPVLPIPRDEDDERFVKSFTVKEKVAYTKVGVAEMSAIFLLWGGGGGGSDKWHQNEGGALVTSRLSISFFIIDKNNWQKEALIKL